MTKNSKGQLASLKRISASLDAERLILKQEVVRQLRAEWLKETAQLRAELPNLAFSADHKLIEFDVPAEDADRWRSHLIATLRLPTTYESQERRGPRHDRRLEVLQ